MGADTLYSFHNRVTQLKQVNYSLLATVSREPTTKATEAYAELLALNTDLECACITHEMETNFSQERYKNEPVPEKVLTNQVSCR